MTGLLRIGEIARRSGLTVTALRFYDQAGVLVPVDVDPTTGYRRYAPGQVRAARAVAALRRIGMSPADIAAVLDVGDDPAAVHDLIAAHVRRLEEGVVLARREAARVGALLAGSAAGAPTDSDGRSPAVVVAVDALAAGVRSVRFAAAAPPEALEFAVLAGICLTWRDDGLLLSATDRVRLAVTLVPRLRGPQESPDAMPRSSTAGASGSGLAASAVIRVDDVEGVLAQLTAAGADKFAASCVAGDPNGLRLDQIGSGGTVAAEVPGLAGCFPEVDRLDPGPGAGRLHDSGELTSYLEVSPVRQRRGRDVVSVACSLGGLEGGGHVDVDRAYLLEAIDALPGGQLTLRLDGPIAPLVLASPARAGAYSLLMPCAPGTRGARPS